MSIAIASAQVRAPSGARSDHPAATFGSAGAGIMSAARGYKYLVPPGPRKCLSNTHSHYPKSSATRFDLGCVQKVILWLRYVTNGFDPKVGNRTRMESEQGAFSRRTWTGSVPSAVADGSALRLTIDRWFCMPIGDPSATADGTDLVQASRPTFEASCY